MTEKRGSFNRFLYGINADGTRVKYVKRLELFLDFSEFAGQTLEEKSDRFLEFSKTNDMQQTTDLIVNYMSYHVDRAKRGEISESTVSNFYKPIKLFCDMNSISFNTKVVTKGIPSGSESSNDRIPTREEILEMLKYPDRRLKPITYTMLSSGIRVSSWEYLQWKHVIPKEREGVIVAAKLIVKNTKIKNRTYFTFISPEAYFALKEWMDFRSSQGEIITGESWLMRDLWNTNMGQVNHNPPRQPNSDSIRMILNRAWKVQDVRTATLDPNSRRKYEFKATHSFRKYFETHALKFMMLLHVKMLMDHDIGVDKSYLKSTEDEILDDYLKVVDLLTISQDNSLKSKEGNKDELIATLTEKMEHMERDFAKVLQVVDISKLRPK